MYANFIKVKFKTTGTSRGILISITTLLRAYLSGKQHLSHKVLIYHKDVFECNLLAVQLKRCTAPCDACRLSSLSLRKLIINGLSRHKRSLDLPTINCERP